MSFRCRKNIPNTPYKWGHEIAASTAIAMLITDEARGPSLTEGMLGSILEAKSLKPLEYAPKGPRPTASDMLVCRLSFEAAQGRVVCKMDGRDLETSGGSASMDVIFPLIAAAAKASGDSMMIISGLDDPFCLRSACAMATLSFATSAHRGFPRIVAEISPQSAAELPPVLLPAARSLTFHRWTSGPILSSPRKFAPRLRGAEPPRLPPALNPPRHKAHPPKELLTPNGDS